MSNNNELATFAGGCFWCLETTFNRLKGVEKAISGYTNGHTSNPSYKEVCGGATGHAEAIQIHYNKDIIDFKTLLTVFFSLHNPTTLNRQGGDIGTQYRSGIYYHNQEQKEMANQMILTLEKDSVFEKIVTEVEPIATFYEAEDYHQDYYNNNRENNGYCTAVIDPKVAKLRKSFSHLLKETA
jgi:peptide-methionine (S)-S-oxide reductase